MSAIQRLFRFPVRPGLVLAGTTLMLGACGGDNDNDGQSGNPPPVDSMASFEVTVTNLTAAQPLSPPALVVHGAAYRAFEVGQPASAAMEELAEAGDHTTLTDEAAGQPAVFAILGGAAPLPPGGSETLRFDVEETNLPGLRLTLLTMLVNTNDAFAGVSAVPLDAIGGNGPLTFSGVAYDAGTELNTETADTIPGPVAGGEGFNPDRDDRQAFVTMHAGVVSRDDGLMDSALTEEHRFDNPVVRVRVLRTN